MTVNTYLNQLARNLVLEESEKDKIKTSLNSLKTKINRHFGSEISSAFQFGSSTRGTMLPRKVDENSDVDVMVVFNDFPKQYQPETYLRKLRAFAETRYTTSEVKPSFPTIVLSLSHIHFELVPALIALGWPSQLSDEKTYHIPDRTSPYMKWIITNPRQSMKYVSGNNGNTIKSLIRLVKYWNCLNGYPFQSFLLEKAIAEQSYHGCSTLEKYFYSFWIYFRYPTSTSEHTRDKVRQMREIVENARFYEELNGSGESLIKKVLPPI